MGQQLADKSITLTSAPVIRVSPISGLLRSVLFLALVVVTTMTFLYAQPAIGFTNESLARILFFHLPNSIIASIVSLISAVYAIKYLMHRKWLDDVRSFALASQAALFWFLTTITGAEFAKVEWGAYWSWDPKQSGIFLLLLAYLGYFSLRASITNPDSKGAVSSGYMILAALITPLLTYVLPNNASDSLHPKGVLFSPDGLDIRYKLVLWSAVFAFGGLSWWIYNLQMRIELVSRAIDVRLTGNTSS